MELIGRFNHRIIRKHDPVELYAIELVYYDLDGTPTDYSNALPSTADGSSLYSAALEMMEAFARPILDHNEIDFSRSVLEKEDNAIGMVYTEKQEDD